MHDLTLVEQADAVRRRALSPVELVEHYLHRIDHLDATVGAFVTVTADRARDAAAAAAVAVDETRPLFGVPTGIKDLYLTVDAPTTFGTNAMPPISDGGDDAFVSRLRAAGAISLGKTNTPEFGAPCYTEPDVAPPARTPWDLSRSAGGSSGGAAAAVAAGLLPAAPGSDGGGSVRIPASVCGLVGLKTSRGRVSNAPRNPEISGLSVHGPIARTVRDAALLLDALAGPAPSDWIWAEPPPRGFLVACDDEPRALRIGRYSTPVLADTDVHPDCLAAWASAAELLDALGHRVEDHRPTFEPDLVPAFETLWSVEFASIPVPSQAEPGLRPLTRWLRERGRAVGATEAFTALARLRAAARLEIEQTQRYDAVLTPTLAQPPVPVGSLRDDADPARDFDRQKRFTPFTSPYNMTGQPAITLPLYWTDAGLPIGVQLVGRPGDEVTLLRLAAQMETARPWAHRRPDCW